jgi:hypothetical protein
MSRLFSVLSNDGTQNLYVDFNETVNDQIEEQDTFQIIMNKMHNNDVIVVEEMQMEEEEMQIEEEEMQMEEEEMQMEEDDNENEIQPLIKQIQDKLVLLNESDTCTIHHGKGQVYSKLNIVMLNFNELEIHELNNQIRLVCKQNNTVCMEFKLQVKEITRKYNFMDTSSSSSSEYNENDSSDDDDDNL